MLDFTEVMQNPRWDNFDIEDLITISATLRAISREFTIQDLPIPPELIEQHRKVLHRISGLRHEYLQTELKRIQASYSAGKTN